MFHFIKEKIAAFLWGTPIGGVLGIKLFFIKIPVWSGLAEFAVKCVGTVILAALSGLMTVFVTDLYKDFLKHRIYKLLKRKKNDRQKRKAETDDTGSTRNTA